MAGRPRMFHRDRKDVPVNRILSALRRFLTALASLERRTALRYAPVVIRK